MTSPEIGNAAAKLPLASLADAQDEEFTARLLIMLLIFIVSLFGAWYKYICHFTWFMFCL